MNGNADLIWQNLRYTMITIGAGLIVKYTGAFFTAAQASSVAEGIVGGAVFLGAIVWGNYVKYRTRAVPVETAARPDVPTVSALTGAIEPATTNMKM